MTGKGAVGWAGACLIAGRSPGVVERLADHQARNIRDHAHTPQQIFIEIICHPNTLHCNSLMDISQHPLTGLLLT